MNTWSDLREEAERILGTRLSQTEQGAVGQEDADTADLPLLVTEPKQQFETQEHELQIHGLELELQNEQLRRSNVELEELRHAYTDLFDHAPVGYVLSDHQGLIRQVNLAACRQLGCAISAHLIGRNLLIFVAPGHHGAFRAYLERLATGTRSTRSEPQVMEVGMNRRDGSPWFARLVGNVCQSGASRGLIRTVITDISEAHQTQADLLHLNLNMDAQIEQRSSQAGFLSHQLQGFMTSVRQSLLTPLLEARTTLEALRPSPSTPFSAAALGNFTTSLPDPDASNAAKLLVAASDQVCRAEQRISSLLDLFECGQRPLLHVPVDMNWVMKRVEHDLSLDLEARRISLSVDPLPTIDGDSQSLRTVFANLIWTAIQALPGDDGGDIRVFAESGHWSLRFGVYLRGCGTGAGRMSESAEVVRPASVTRDLGEEGPRLAVSRKLTERHGGTLWVDNETSDLIAFWVQWPTVPTRK